jgi:16S rRNA (guanine1207-N2)-methyltransferase
MPHYFDELPGVVSQPGTVRLKLADLDAELVSDRGVFSATRLDPGTAVLLEAGASAAAERGLEGNLLDLGCGYGPVACTVARRNPRATVWALDVNRRALNLTGRNALRLGLTNVVTATPEEVPRDMFFEGIWSNPPIRIGKPALQELLSDWLDRLAGGATARLVVARNLGADSLAGWLGAKGFKVEKYSSKRGYRLLAVRTGEGRTRESRAGNSLAGDATS